MAFNPTDSAFQGFDAVELHPDMLSHRGSLDELDFAAFGRGVEDANPKTATARTPNVHLEIVQGLSLRASRLRTI